MLGGIVDKDSNPFSTNSWIKQGFGLTPDRQNQLKPILGKTKEQIKRIKRNEGRYPAFVAIRWGFAVIKESRLEPTEKWHNRELYDQYGDYQSSKREYYSSNFKLKKRKAKKRREIKTALRRVPLDPFTSERDLIISLSAFRVSDIIKSYKMDIANKSPAELLNYSVYRLWRSFGGERPSKKYKSWHWYEHPNMIVSNLHKIKSQNEFDEYAFDLGKSLANHFYSQSGMKGISKMTEGVSMKFVNLILKHFSFSDHVMNEKLTSFLHVPWDKYTLQPIKKLFRNYAEDRNIPKIRSGQGMFYVSDLSIYIALHEFITGIAEQAGVTRIYYEFMAWNTPHSA